MHFSFFSPPPFSYTPRSTFLLFGKFFDIIFIAFFSIFFFFFWAKFEQERDIWKCKNSSLSPESGNRRVCVRFQVSLSSILHANRLVSNNLIAGYTGIDATFKSSNVLADTVIWMDGHLVNLCAVSNSRIRGNFWISSTRVKRNCTWTLFFPR